MNGEKKVAVLYIHVSNKEQAREVFSLPEQEKYLLDGLTHSIYDVAKLMKILNDYNCDLDCFVDESNTITVNGRMVMRITTSVSQSEIERYSERAKIDMVRAIKVEHIPNRTHLVLKEKIRN